MRVPIATYRLQFGPSFGFKDAQEAVPYLARLGISDLYASPILRATQDSTHGYDVTDPAQLNPKLGTEEDFLSLAAERQDHNLGWLQDIVPNHMAYSSENAFLMDVFENGPQSEYYDWFDVFRDHPDPEMRTKVLAPILGAPLDEILGQGQLQLALDEDGLALRYYDWRLPLSLASYDEVLGRDLDPSSQPLVEVCTGWAQLNDVPAGPEKTARVASAKSRLLHARATDRAAGSHLDGVLDFYNGRHGPEPLRNLLDRQWYRLAFWQHADRNINYRRFFYLNTFIALCIEKPEVFDRIHEKIMSWVDQGVVTGLRIDHIDGLHDPLDYLRRLRERAPQCYLVVEKILELEEMIPTQWPIEGTSGYKFCNYVNGIFCDGGSEPAFTDLYHEFIGRQVDYATMLYETKLRVLQEHMGGEVAYLAHLVRHATAEGDEESPRAWERALAALIAAFGVYRTYIDVQQFTDQDRAFITAAVLFARDKAPDEASYIDRIGQLLLSYRPALADSGGRDAQRYVIMRFQQFTGPAMAKGLEDTLFYTYNRFVSLNEVGGDPASFGVPLDRFHRFNEMRARHWPGAMNATSTHDAKRGEDVRARLNVLTEMPQRWAEKVRQWTQLNADFKASCEGTSAPDANDEYLLYQTLVGAWPFDEEQVDAFKQRLKDYMIKALREAKRRTNWTAPNEPYENGTLAFIDRVLDADTGSGFLRKFLPFQKEISAYGAYNSLSQITLKMTCPGVPDFYQGAELWDLSLVDPDNRRPVDFKLRNGMLETLRYADGEAAVDLGPRLLAANEDGRVKLFLIRRLLHVRAAHPALFRAGDYVPLELAGPWARHAIAFLRRGEDTDILVVVPRFITDLVPGGEPPVGRTVWADTRVTLGDDASGLWYDAITGQVLTTDGGLPVGEILHRFPVGVLLRQPLP